MKKKIFLLIKISRPIGWIVAPLVFLAGLHSSNAQLNFFSIFQLLMLSFPLCLAGYGINDIYDYESDRVNPRKKKIEGIVLKPKYHEFVKKSVFFMMFLLALSSLITMNLTNIISMSMLLFFGYFYSAPPLRFKERPPLDSISNGIIYFLAPFLLGHSFGGSIFAFSLKWLLITLFVAGIHSFSTVMDYSVDKKIKVKTFAVVFGKRSASFFALIMSLLALVFGNFNTLINYYLVFCGTIFFITLIHPSEKLASLFFKFIFIGFVLGAIAYIFLDFNF